MRLNLLFFLGAALLGAACKDTGKESVPAEADADADTDTDTDTDTDADADPDCWVDSDGDGQSCWDCDLPTTPEEGSLKFLNQCTGADNAPFDNSARIPASTWVPGTALPQVP